jgi:hypothetical protein
MISILISFPPNKLNSSFQNLCKLNLRQKQKKIFESPQEKKNLNLK